MKGEELITHPTFTTPRYPLLHKEGYGVVVWCLSSTWVVLRGRVPEIPLSKVDEICLNVMPEADQPPDEAGSRRSRTETYDEAMPGVKPRGGHGQLSWP
jgi:hypothetical protein